MELPFSNVERVNFLENTLLSKFLVYTVAFSKVAFSIHMNFNTSHDTLCYFFNMRC